MPGYGWVIPGYALLSLIMPEYARICINLSEWVFFTITHSNPLSKGTIDCFLEEQKFDFFYSSWKHLILFFVLARIFLQVRFRICCYIWRPRGPGAVNLDIPNKHIYGDFLNDLFIYFVVAVFPLFGAWKDFIRDSERL